MDHFFGILLMVGVIAGGLLSLAAGKIASNQGRNALGYFLLSLVLTPILVIFLLLLLGESTSKAVRESGGQPQEVVKVRCAGCGAAVTETSSFCPECGRELEAARS